MRKFMKIFVNLLTAFRLLFPISFIFMFNKVSATTFIILIALLFLTDFFDGILARKFKVQSLFGSKMDTMADKVLAIILIILLLKKLKILWGLLIGELIISIINVLAVFQGRETHSVMIGRIKTWFISVSIILGYIYYYKYISYTVVLISFIITFIIEAIVIWNYIKYIYSQKISDKIHQNVTLKEILYKLFDTDYYLKNEKEN